MKSSECLVDDHRDMATRTPRAVRGRLLACLQHSGGDRHQRPVWHLPLGLGLLDLAGLQRRHRAHRVLRLLVDPRHGAPVARRSPSASCAHGTSSLRSWGARHPPRPPRPAPAWSSASWGSLPEPAHVPSCSRTDGRLLSSLRMSQAAVQRAPARVDASVVTGGKPAPFPGFVEPCHPTLREEAPAGARWVADASERTSLPSTRRERAPDTRARRRMGVIVETPASPPNP